MVKSGCDGSQLCLQSLGLASERLKKGRELCLEESMKLQAQLSSVLSNADLESFRFKSEQKTSLFQAKRALQCQREAG